MYALNNYNERCMYVAKLCVFLCETKKPKTHFFPYCTVFTHTFVHAQNL